MTEHPDDLASLSRVDRQRNSVSRPEVYRTEARNTTFIHPDRPSNPDRLGADVSAETLPGWLVRAVVVRSH